MSKNQKVAIQLKQTGGDREGPESPSRSCLRRWGFHEMSLSPFGESRSILGKWFITFSSLESSIEKVTAIISSIFANKYKLAIHNSTLIFLTIVSVRKHDAAIVPFRAVLIFDGRQILRSFYHDQKRIRTNSVSNHQDDGCRCPPDWIHCLSSGIWRLRLFLCIWNYWMEKRTWEVHVSVWKIYEFFSIAFRESICLWMFYLLRVPARCTD